ncbi:MAG: hypothetical protein PUB98_03115 [Clostridiales bacterium]|nr:hypothetical protein [Clostridiales bacterium]
MEYIGVMAGGAMFLVGMTFFVYQLNKIIVIDAKTREIPSPKKAGFWAALGQRGEGLLAYFLIRKKYRVVAKTKQQEQELERGKKKALVGIVFMALGAILFVIGFLFF